MTRNQFRWRLLKQALLQKKAKAVIILLAVTMGASVVAGLLNLQLDLRARMNRELRDYGPNVVIQPESAGNYVSHSVLSNLAGASFRNHLLAYTPHLIVPIQIQERPVLMSVVDLRAHRRLYPSLEWSFKTGVDESTAVFIGKRLAEKLQLKDRENILFRNRGQNFQLPIAGTVESGETEDDQVFISPSLAARLGFNANGYHTVLVSALGEMQQVEKDFQSFVEQNPSVQYKVIRKIAAAELNILDKISSLMGLVIFLISVILFFCIQTTVSAILISRQSEIALLRVLGARRKQITAVLTSELLLLGLLGGATGYVVGIVMAQLLGKILFQAFIAPSSVVFLVTLFFSLFLMLISSFLPISRAVNRQAAVVLKET